METMLIKTKTKDEFDAIKKYAQTKKLDFYTSSEKANDFALGLLMEESRNSGFMGTIASKEFIERMANDFRLK